MRDTAFAYNNAYLQYGMGNHSAALKSLVNADLSDLFYYLGGRSLQLRIYFEQQDWQGFFSLIDTFKHYLKRNTTISEFQYTLHWNLLKYTGQLARIVIRQDELKPSVLKARHQKVTATIEATPQIAYRSWLLQQAKAIVV
jgi:hypothetical protein